MRKKNYTVKEDYFDKWSHNMAYLLGFIVADGCLRRDGYYVKVEVAPKDVCVLNFFCSQITPDYVLKYTQRGSEVRWYPSSKKLKESLMKKGIFPCKTGNEQIPDDLPKKYQWDFIRGYFDGDGCVEDCCLSTSCDSEKFLEGLIQITQCGYIRPDRKHFKWIIECKKQVKYFFDNTYGSGNFWLQRKYDRFAMLLTKPVKNGRFSCEEDLFIKNNFENMTRRELAEKLQRNASSVKNRIQRLKIKKAG